MEEVKVTKKLFGGNVDFIIYNAEKYIVEDIIDEVYNEGLRLQKIFNVYDKKSEVSLLNNSKKSIVSDELIYLLKKALEFSKITKGNYDVSLGKYILLRKQGKIESPKCSYKDILINKNEVTFMNDKVMLDFGSIAKGYITDKIVDMLEKKRIKNFLIDSRGDICVRGNYEYILDIQNPRENKKIFSIKIKNQSVATSGDYNQYYGKFDFSHIINQKEAISVTAVSKTLEEADVYATAIFTSPLEIRKKIINSNKKIKLMIIEKENNLKMFNGFKKIVYFNEK